MRVTVEDHTKNLTDAVQKAAFNNFGHAAASIRKDAIASIKRPPGVATNAGLMRDAKGRFTKGSGRKRVRHEPSPPGTPPYSATGRLRTAIIYFADKTGAVIGPAASIFGEAGAAHEFGGEFKKQHYPERPFMFPALQRGAPRFAEDWEGSVGT
jgi:hypothetical protein